MFHPVVVNPWVREDVILNREHLPWIPGDVHQTTQNNDNADNAVVTDEQAVVVHHGDKMEEDFTMPDGEGTQLEGAQQSADEDDGDHQDSALQTTEQSVITERTDTQLEQEIDKDDDAGDDSALPTTEQDTVQKDASPLLETPTINNTYHTRSQAVQNADVTMQDVSEQDESSSDDPDRIYCICNDSVDGGTMVQCDNHRDNDVSCHHVKSFSILFANRDPKCRGKWFHLKCVGLSRTPADDVRWYCMDCRKKLRRGVFSKGIVK